MTALHTVLTDVFDRGVERRLSVEDERTTLTLAKQGDSDATVALIYAYAAALRGAVGALRHAGGGWSADGHDASTTDDLRGAALLGFMEAIQAFDTEVHDRLAAVVAGNLRDALSSHGLTGPIAFSVPDRTRKRFFFILRAAHGDYDLAADLAPQYEMSRESFLSIRSAVADTSSFEVLVDGEGESPRSREEAAWGGEAHPLWEGAFADAEDAILVDAAFAAVDTFERDVCRLAYGFSEHDTVPDAEIAARLGYSRPKIQRTRAAALTKMRSALGAA
jgi:DNA-directed RNA polymerase specialized sigma subunit